MYTLSTTIPRQKEVQTVYHYTDHQFTKSTENNHWIPVPTAVRLLLFAALSFVMIGGRANARHVNYYITDLGVLPSNNQSYATRLNDLGQVVGRSVDPGVGPGGNSRGFLWQPNAANAIAGTMYDLGLLSGGTTSMAFGINNRGAVSGYANDSGGALRSVQWAPTAIPAIPAPVPAILTGSQPVSSLISLGSNINNSGNVAATVGGPGTSMPPSAIFWNTSPVTIQNTWGGTAINDVNQVVGHAPKYAGTYQAYRWTPTSPGLLQNIGDPGIGGVAFQGPSNGNDINAQGDVVGNYQTGGDQWLTTGVYNGFLWENGPVQTPVNIVPSLIESSARGLNDNQDVVGFMTQTVFARKAFISEPGFRPTLFDLNPLVTSGNSYQNWVLQSAEDINNVGQIVGYGTVNGQTRAYLLTPIPEPASLALALFGLVSQVAIRRRGMALTRRWQA